jgi:NADPH-dependent 2,4-dienoyl-CoA reductase/sulfur reductase-like enzyme
MPDYKYLIIGGGMTADAAVSGIRELDPDGAIGIITSEANSPYNRPPLSKGLWKGKPLETIFRQASKENAEIHLERSAKSIDPNNKLVTDEQERTYTYEKLLLATGGSPRKLPFGGDEIIYFRTINDFQNLQRLTKSKSRFAVIGGGFIGSELASVLSDQEQEVAMLFPEDGIGALLFPPDIASYLNDYYRQKGVQVLAGEMVSDIEQNGSEFTIKSKSGIEINVDHIVAGIGILPNTDLAEEAGIDIDNGILVNEYLQTNQEDIYAAGDVANIYIPVLDARMRIEHEDNALSSGTAAGKNMTGEGVPYDHISSFYSDMFELGYEAVGELNPKFETFADWIDPYKKGVVYYLDQGKVRGVLLWNVWDQVDPARKIISEPGPLTKDMLSGRITG